MWRARIAFVLSVFALLVAVFSRNINTLQAAFIAAAFVIAMFLLLSIRPPNKI